MLAIIFYLCSTMFFTMPVIAGPLPEEVEYQGNIPDCDNGEKALLAAGVGVYPCEKKCPEGFQCKYKTTNATVKYGICCPNLNELYKIYGNEGEKITAGIKKIT